MLVPFVLNTALLSHTTHTNSKLRQNLTTEIQNVYTERGRVDIQNVYTPTLCILLPLENAAWARAVIERWLTRVSGAQEKLTDLPHKHRGKSIFMQVRPAVVNGLLWIGEASTPCPA